MNSRLSLFSAFLCLSLPLAAKDATVIPLPKGFAKTPPPLKDGPSTKELPTEKESPPAKEENPSVTFEKGKVREIKVNLLDEKSKPVSGATVNLYGQDNGSRWPGKDSDKTDHWWQFKTNDSGVFTVRFPTKPETWGESAPQPGVFYLVAELPDGRRAVSSRIFHGISRDESSDTELNEWDAEGGGDWIFTNEAHEMDMVLTAGHTITGTVVTPDGKPLAGKTISAIHDLHVDSDNGSGGEVFHVKATSDDEGHFKLEHIYTVACRLHADGAWTRTRITYKTEDGSSTRWSDQPLDKLPDISDDESLDLTIVIAPKAPTYRYFGVVTNSSGKPQAGLLVTAGVSAHATPDDFADTHRFETAVTTADGSWSIEASSPWVRFFDIKKDEKSEDSLGGEGYENDAFELAAPGEYNLKVKASAPAAKAAAPKKKAK